MVERTTVNRLVVGSSPTRGAIIQLIDKKMDKKIYINFTADINLPTVNMLMRSLTDLIDQGNKDFII